MKIGNYVAQKNPWHNAEHSLMTVWPGFAIQWTLNSVNVGNCQISHHSIVSSLLGRNPRGVWLSRSSP